MLTRVFLFCLLLAGMLSSSGCFLTTSLWRAGVHGEYPEDHGTVGGALREAYVSSDGKQLTLKYHVSIPLGDPSEDDRWLDIERSWLDKTLAKRPAHTFRTDSGSVRLGSDTLRSQVSKKSRWDVTQMTQVKVRRVQSPEEAGPGGFIGFVDPKDVPRDKSILMYHYAMPCDNKEGAELLEFNLPSRDVRTTKGYVVQVFQPLAWVGDIVLFPFYLPALIAGR